jgi:hypothetical protein
MRNQVLILLPRKQEFQLTVDEAHPMERDAARIWLDEQFVAFDCEPLRASGKVLNADKVLRIAESADPALFADAQWSATFAKAVFAMLGKPMIRIDVPAMAVTY